MVDDPNRKPSDPDTFGPGMKADGTVKLLTVEEAAAAKGVRDAEEAAFENEDDDLSDLDDITEEITDA